MPKDSKVAPATFAGRRMNSDRISSEGQKNFSETVIIMMNRTPIHVSIAAIDIHMLQGQHNEGQEGAHWALTHTLTTSSISL